MQLPPRATGEAGAKTPKYFMTTRRLSVRPSVRPTAHDSVVVIVSKRLNRSSNNDVGVGDFRSK